MADENQCNPQDCADRCSYHVKKCATENPPSSVDKTGLEQEVAAILMVNHQVSNERRRSGDHDGQDDDQYQQPVAGRLLVVLFIKFQRSKNSSTVSKSTYLAVHPSFIRALHFPCHGVHFVDLCHRLRERQTRVFHLTNVSECLAFASRAFDRPWTDPEQVLMVSAGIDRTIPKTIGVELRRLHCTEVRPVDEIV